MELLVFYCSAVGLHIRRFFSVLYFPVPFPVPILGFAADKTNARFYVQQQNLALR